MAADDGFDELLLVLPDMDIVMDIVMDPELELLPVALVAGAPVAAADSVESAANAAETPVAFLQLALGVSAPLPAPATKLSRAHCDTTCG